MSKNRPVQLNLLALLAALTIVALVYLTLGRGLWFQIALSLAFQLPWTAQFLLLALAANARRAPPPYVSNLTFAIWSGAMFPFIGLSAPPGMFPSWFIVASAPVGFLLCYAMISIFTWTIALIPRWRFPWTKNT